MTIFEARKIETIHPGKLSFFKLVQNNNCLFDDFVDTINNGKFNNYKSELKKLMTWMQLMAENDSTMPKNKFNSIKDGDKVIAHEFKSLLCKKGSECNCYTRWI